ncbi:hypothetical protein FOL47_008388 [Perkinsus chesapeaki]|uniref:Uncharacterized protein n=1 Tax=Perkinsus chesapeaki TaxID=330153 RepID=A0A7J6LF13_PERCH|nr:hypothetical protein FOL47_008388 [Perkinsus chesapeaki]
MKNTPPLNWRTLPFCDGAKGTDCYFCDNMTAKNCNANRRKGRSGRPKKESAAVRSNECQPGGSSGSSSSSSTMPVLMLVDKEALGSCGPTSTDGVLSFSQLSVSAKHALLVDASQKENLAGQVSTGCASAFRKQLGNPKGTELILPKVKGKPVTYQQVFSREAKPKLSIGIDFLNRIQTTATVSNKALERIRGLLQKELCCLITLPSRANLQEDRSRMKSEWRTTEIGGRIVAMIKCPVSALRDRFGEDCVLRLSGDSGGGLIQVVGSSHKCTCFALSEAR